MNYPFNHIFFPFLPSVDLKRGTHIKDFDLSLHTPGPAHFGSISMFQSVATHRDASEHSYASQFAFSLLVLIPFQFFLFKFLHLKSDPLEHGRSQDFFSGRGNTFSKKFSKNSQIIFK